ncbi:MAG: hypothetical protein R6U63_07485 [Longimicrobiales bacterium]
MAFTKIRAGADHFRAIGTDTEVYCWGYNDFGEVGDGTLDRLKVEPGRVIARFVIPLSTGMFKRGMTGKRPVTITIPE